MSLLSIVVPIYKVESYIYKCVESIINQTYKNIEVILVDDGSPDKCGDICDYFSSVDKRVKVIHKKNGGLSSARNEGIKRAKGDYIAFVDGDDWVKSDMYEILINALEETDSDIAQCDFFREEGEELLEENYNNYNVWNMIESLRNLQGEYRVITTVSWNKIYKKDLFNDIQFPVGSLYEDSFTTPKLLFKSNKIVFVPVKKYFYRITPGSITQSEFNIRKLDGAKSRKEILKLVENLNDKNLYESVLEYYLYDLINAYKNILISNMGYEDELKYIIEEFNKYYISNKRVQGTTLKKKLRFKAFSISPSGYVFFNNCIKKLKL